jgi:hypothetical protein
MFLRSRGASSSCDSGFPDRAARKAIVGAGCRGSLAEHRSPLAEYRSPLAEYRSPLAEYRSPLAEYRSLVN